MERSGHCIIAIIVIAHQLVHAAAKAFFSEDSTPEGLGPESGGDSKAGWAGEGQLFGGYVSLEWAGGFPAFKIDQITGFFLEDPTTGQQYPIEREFCFLFCFSSRRRMAHHPWLSSVQTSFSSVGLTTSVKLSFQMRLSHCVPSTSALPRLPLLLSLATRASALPQTSGTHLRRCRYALAQDLATV